MRALLILVAACGTTTTSAPQPGDPACTVTQADATCHSQPIVAIGSRRVWWATPTGAAPVTGWPAVVLYQGTGAGPSLTWDVDVPPSTAFGGYYQVALVAQLLAAGFVVIQPEADGGRYWYTNAPLTDYDTSPDATFIPALLGAIDAGTFDHVDTTRLYATGISSGGYMTSRMAVSYAGKFRALAIASGSYATCLGAQCTVPDQLPADHPPTLFLHGESDTIVPIATARDYDSKLRANGKVTRFVSDPDAGHQWLATAPAEVPAWFAAH